ncbi:MAG TPA: hypothetical protein VLM91_17090 [Candidatus Methylomirabilis sp.]|nr:hypothetical protein [Candidatus Methylomirabilis sp.]
MLKQPDQPVCMKCRHDDRAFPRLDSFDRLRLADDPADPNCGHIYLETVYILQCPACGHHQEQVHQRKPYPTLRQAQSELDAHLLGKG